LNNHLFSGRAPIKTGLAIYEQYKSMSVVLEIDIEKNCLVHISLTVLLPETADFIHRLIPKNISLENGIKPVTDLMEEHIHLNIVRPVVKATEMAYENYCNFMKERQ
jgi:hypothetical protein